VITAQVFFMTFGSVPRVFPDDLCEGFVKFHFWESIAGLLLVMTNSMAHQNPELKYTPVGYQCDDGPF
jgi:hypothetical protein